MIISGNVTIRGHNFVRTYSDRGLYIRQMETGKEYSEAFDVPYAGYTYEETIYPIETDEELSAEEALAELMEVLE